MAAKPKYHREIYNHYTFVFKYEPDIEDEMLHIWVRHTKEPMDAMEAFFEGDTEWNHEHKRFETVSPTNTVHWFWLDEGNDVVMIISCFDTI